MRWAAWVAGVTAALLAIYLVGINVFVRTRMLRSALSEDPEEMLVDYTSAYSVIPGQVHVEGLSIRGSDWNIQWILRIDKCDFRFSPLDFLHRRFHASHVRGDGLTFRVRLRVDEATPEHVAALPPVPGFGEFPHRKPGPQPPPPTDAQYRLWSVQLEDVDAQDVHEIWVDTLRYAGNLRVRGRWIFRPMRWLDVGPAVVDAAPLDISYGPHVLAQGLRGSIGVTVHPFDLRGPQGIHILQEVSADVRLKGLLRAADTLESLLPVSGLSFVRGDGPLDAVIQMDRGVLASGTKVSFDSDDTRTTAPKLAIDGPAHARFEVVAEAGKPVGRLDANGDGIQLLGEEGAKATLKTATATIWSRELALEDPFEELWLTSHMDLTHVVAHLGSAEVSAQALDVATDLTASRPKQTISGGATLAGTGLKGDWQKVGMSGDLSAHLAGGVGLRDGLVDLAGSDVVVRHLQAHLGSEPLAGTLSAHVRARRGKELTDLSDTEITFEGAAGPPSSQTQGWWARAKLTNATLRRAPAALDATIHLTAKDASVAAAVIATQTSIPQWVLNAVPMTHLDATCDVVVRPSSVQVHSLLARGDSDSVRFEYDSSSWLTEWAMLIEEGALQVGLHQTPAGLDFAPFVGVPWFAARSASLRERESEGL